MKAADEEVAPLLTRDLVALCDVAFPAAVDHVADDFLGHNHFALAIIGAIAEDLPDFDDAFIRDDRH
jgi:hypothetical protein